MHILPLMVFQEYLSSMLILRSRVLSIAYFVKVEISKRKKNKIIPFQFS